MKQKLTIYIMTGFLAVSAALITGLAKANKTTDRMKTSMMHAQKHDTNDDGATRFDELTTCQNRHFAKLDRDENGIIENHEFNSLQITMFYLIDRDGDSVLRK